MTRFLALALLFLSACTDAMLSAGVDFGTDSASAKPTLSGTVGDGTVYIQPY